MVQEQRDSGRTTFLASPYDLTKAERDFPRFIEIDLPLPTYEREWHVLGCSYETHGVQE